MAPARENQCGRATRGICESPGHRFGECQLAGVGCTSVRSRVHWVPLHRAAQFGSGDRAPVTRSLRTPGPRVEGSSRRTTVAAA